MQTNQTMSWYVGKVSVIMWTWWDNFLGKIWITESMSSHLVSYINALLNLYWTFENDLLHMFVYRGHDQHLWMNFIPYKYSFDFKWWAANLSRGLKLETYWTFAAHQYQIQGDNVQTAVTQQIGDNEQGRSDDVIVKKCWFH